MATSDRVRHFVRAAKLGREDDLDETATAVLALIRARPGIHQAEMTSLIPGGRKAASTLMSRELVHFTPPTDTRSPKDNEWWPGARPHVVLLNSERDELAEENRRMNARLPRP